MNIDQFYNQSVNELKNLGFRTAELDVRVILKYVLKKDDAYLLLEPEMPLTYNQLNRIKKLVERRKKGEPIAYLTNHKEFFGYDFFINKYVLVPRPESEKLVELALDFVKLKVKGEKLKVLDIGTGSGCLIISLAKELESLSALSLKPLANLFASDISRAALSVAKKNARTLLNNRTIEQSNNLHFFHSDLFSNRLLHKKYDIVVANLPYVPKKVKSQKLKVKINESIYFEPEDAIFAEDNGAAIIKKFLSETRRYIAKNGLILIELDPRNAIDIKNYAQKIYSNSKTELSKDLARLDRYLTICA